MTPALLERPTTAGTDRIPTADAPTPWGPLSGSTTKGHFAGEAFSGELPLYRVPRQGDLTPGALTMGTLTRRGLLGGGLLGAAALGLAACGSSADSASGTATTTSGTRTIDTAKGSVTIPASPQRIVAIQPSATATLYDVGLTPVGVYDDGAEYISPRYRTAWTAAPKVGSNGEIDLEKIAAASPDLIIGTDYPWNTDSYAKLTAIAPTVIAPVTTWQATAHTVADAGNRLDRLTALQARLTARSAQIRKDYAAQLTAYPWNILQGGFDAGKFWLYGPASDAGVILAGAGVRFASASAKVHGNGPSVVSYENIDILADGGVVGFYANFDGTPNNKGPQLFTQPGFKTLDAVKAGRTVALPDFLPGGYGDALALLDEAESGLKAMTPSS